jgi:hypothetical protein
MKYKIGTDDPAFYRDIGSGAWKSQPATLTAQAEKLFIVANICHASVVVGRHAAAHLSHYFGNSGAVYNTDLRALVNSVSLAKYVFDSEVQEAKKFTETLPPGKAEITSSKCSGGVNDPTENKDWYYAIGAYQAWGKATVNVPPADSKPRVFSMSFEYCLFDQYNWNGGGSVSLLGRNISDKDMGLFHKMGLAREYEVRGSFFVDIEWTPGVSSAVTVPTTLQMAGVGQGIGL